MPVALGSGSPSEYHVSGLSYCCDKASCIPLALAGPSCYHRATSDDAPGPLAELLGPLRKSTLRYERCIKIPMSAEECAVGGQMVSPPRKDVCDLRFDSL
jgi:hypothetical protein